VRGASRAPEISSACLVRPDLAGFGGGLCLRCDDEDDGRRDNDGGDMARGHVHLQTGHTTNLWRGLT